MKNTIILVVAVATLVGGISFFTGTKYQQNKQAATRRQFTGQFGNTQQAGFGQGRLGGANGNRMGFRPVNGEITAVDDKSITVKLSDGSSKIVIVSDKTELNKADIATTSDLKIGEKVAVFGSENTDGSVSAQNIQLNPIIRAIPSSSQFPPVN